jgi:hypothetical protein
VTRGHERIEIVAFKVAQAGQVKIKETPKPDVRIGGEQGLRQIAVVPRYIQFTSFCVVLRKEYLIGDGN